MDFTALHTGEHKFSAAPHEALPGTCTCPCGYPVHAAAVLHIMQTHASTYSADEGAPGEFELALFKLSWSSGPRLSKSRAESKLVH